MTRVLLGLVIGAALLVAQGMLLAGAWGELPVEVAVHFGADGVADGWGPKSSILWICGLVSVVVLVCFHVPAVLIRWMPRRLLNFPNKAYWLAPERAASTVVRLQASMLRMGNISLAAGLMFTSGLLDANLAEEQKLSWLFIPCLLLYVAGVILWAFSLQRRFALPR